jgi:hypothetical protein
MDCTNKLKLFVMEDDEFACVDVQHEANDEDSGDSRIDGVNEGLSAFLSSTIIDADETQNLE